MWQEFIDDEGNTVYVNLQTNHMLNRVPQDAFWRLRVIGAGSAVYLSDESKDALLAEMPLSRVRQFRAMVGKQYKGVLITTWDACAGQVIFADGSRMADDKAFKALNS